MAALTKNQSKGLSEAEVLNQCTAYLTARGIYHWRQNTGAFKVENRFIRTGMKGGAIYSVCFPAVDCLRLK